MTAKDRRKDGLTPRQRRRRGTSGRVYTPKRVQQEIVARSMGGQTKSEIARATRKNRDTVSRILSLREYDQLVAEGQSKLAKMIPKAVKRVDENLAPTKPHHLQAAFTVLKGMGALPKKPEDVATRLKPTEFSDLSDEELDAEIEAVEKELERAAKKSKHAGTPQA